MSNLLKILISLLLIIIAVVGIGKNSVANDPISELERVMAENTGKVIYLDFWASWCVPCRKSFPWMNAMQAQHQKKGFIVLSVNLDAQPTLADKFLQQTPADFSVIYDEKGALAKKFKVKGMPSSYLFDRQGKLISAHMGFTAKKQQKYELEITQALAL